MIMTPEEVLLKAAESIGEHGHTKGSFFKYGPPGEEFSVETASACAMGAIARAVDKVSTSKWIRPGTSIVDEGIDGTPAAQLLADHLRAKFPGLFNHGPVDNFVAISRFNDHHTVTGEDVILAMKEAAHHG